MKSCLLILTLFPLAAFRSCLIALIGCYKTFATHISEAWVYRKTGSGFVRRAWNETVLNK